MNNGDNTAKCRIWNCFKISVYKFNMRLLCCVFNGQSQVVHANVRRFK